MAPFLGATATVYGRNMKRLVRIPLLLFFSLFQPLLFLLLLGQSLGRVASVPGFPYDSYLAFFAPSVVMLTALNSSFQSGLGTVDDFESGFLDKLLTTPAPRLSLLAGKIGADASRIALQALLILLIAMVMGLEIATGPGGMAIILVIAAAFGVAWAGLSNIVAMVTRNSEATMMVGIMLSFPVLFLSNAMMPESLLPSWLTTVARYNPASYVIDAVRALVNSGYDWAAVGKAAGIIAVLGAVTLTGTVRQFRKVAV